ncbi:UNVERIFIED_CONTAM: Tpr [Trichonephila clavipes]
MLYSSVTVMEGCAKLESFLEEQELSSIPEITKEKIIERFSNLNQLVSELRNENSELKVILESEQFKFEKEISASRQQLQQSTELCTKLKLQITELGKSHNLIFFKIQVKMEKNINQKFKWALWSGGSILCFHATGPGSIPRVEESQSSIQKQWRDLQKVQDSSSLELQSVKRENELLNQEKRSLSEQLEKRRSEIEKLNDDVKSLLDQVNSANEAKFAAIASVEEVKVKESNLQHQVNRLQQEKELLTQQITDLNAELTLKSNEIHTLKREKCNSNLELKTLLEDRVDELRTAQKKTELYKSILDERNTRVEQLADKIRQLNEVISKSEEQFQYELSTQTKLIDLYKAASENNQKRVQELMRAFEEAQKLLKESNDSCEDMEKHCAEVENKCKAQLEEKQNEITKLKDELRRVKEAAHGLNQDTIEKIFPVAAATSKVLHSGITLTELYVEYTRIQEELQIQKDENANLTRELKQIISEIEEKTPIINQRMLEYDKMNETISSLKSRLANSMSEFDQVLQERNDINRLYNLSERENTRLKSQVTDLNKQVQVLLKEVEEARGGVIKNDRGSSAMNEEEVTSRDDITAAKVISRHLVTFRDIEEIQRKNQKLLVAIRDLSEQHEELEKKLSTEITNKFEKEIASLSEQLGDLQKKRTKQSEMIETIIRQRDMYRVLLTSQGFSETLLGQTDGSSTLLQKSSEFSSDPQLKEAKAAMTQLQAEFDRYKKEKSENERLLTEQVDQMRSTISDLKIEKAKLASQCDYFDERMKMLQSNLDVHKKEHASSRDKNNQLTALILQHQQNINSMRQDLMIAQEKAAQAKVTIENLKAERDLLKSVETRLLQEKESVIKEQQHQSRMMANLQTVQNNLERIESETKRNLQYQVEKYEKENAILKTKLENAHEEYRSAVKVWEKQKKEMQVKIDAEVERSRKIHEDLIDAYSQVHALNQDLVNTKSQLTAERPASAESPVKTPSKTVVSNAQTAAEVKMLKEQLNEAQVKLKTLQDKLSLTGKSAEQYQNMCKDLELRVKEQDEINKHLKESMESALKSSNEARTALEKNLENIEKNNRELIEENMKLSQDSNFQVNELQKKLTEILKTMEDYKNKAETAKNTADQAREDCQNQIKLMKDVQDKYERELMLHAQDIQALTELKEKHQKCSIEIENLTEKAKSAEQTLSESRESWARQEETLRSEIEALKTKIADFETCNNDLHHQLELMGTQMAALQSKNWEETPYSSIQSDLKDTQHLLQVIQFIKKEKEIASTQLDMVQSENIRLTLKVDQLTNDLSGAKAELKDIMNDVQAKATSEAQHAELLKKIEMMNLLSESNNLLRMEKESLSEAKTKLEIQFQELTEKFQPLNEKEKEMNLQIDMLSAENNALRHEVKSWQSRTNQLLEQSHRIGPQEYKNMRHVAFFFREIEELKSQKSRLTEELQRKQAEASQVTASMTSLKKELDNLRNELKQKSDEIARLNEKIIEDQKTLLQIKKIGRKYKTQFDELKVSYDALLVKAEASDSSNQEQIVQEMQKKVEESDKIVKELKEEINKQKESTNQAKKEVDDVQSKANEKEEKAKKLLAQFRQKYSQLNVQKDALASENSVLAKEVEEYKTKLSTYMQAQEDNALLKSQSEARIALLENELKRIEEIRKERDFLQKQYEELQQKVSHQKQSMKSPIVGLGERTSGGGTEPLTANIKPLTSPSTSGAAASLRHSPHPVSNVNRPTPTASIRPMAIGTSSPATSQTRMATVLPTTATPSHSEEVVPPTSVSVPHATVQPTPATATVAPTTMAVTVSPVISEVAPSLGHDDSQTSIPSLHNTGTQAVSMPVTALVPPRVDVSEQVPEAVTVDSPAPTTSVIVSPPATQTQVVTPTVKRPREESPGSSDSAENSLKRIRMVSEGSQTNQQHPTLVVVPTNIAVVPAAQIVNRSKSQTSPAREPEPSTSSIQTETEESPVLDTATTPLINSSPDEDLIAVPFERTEAEILEDDKEQVIDWELQEESKIDEDFETEGMEEATMDEVEEGEQMQGIDRSPDDEDMAEEQQDDTEEMLDQPTPTAPDIDILDSTSDTQMDADSSSQQNVPNEPCMAPPAFPPTLETLSNATPSVEPVISSVASTSAPRATLAVSAPRLERQQPVNRQHLTPFTIPGQGSNFEEGDDGIVPSTPTLYVPRRTDGFAEAVSSPHVPQVRFLFSSSDNSPTQQGLSQLASQGGTVVDPDDLSKHLKFKLLERYSSNPPLPVQVGLVHVMCPNCMHSCYLPKLVSCAPQRKKEALGVDDTRMDLSQYDEGGRSVPSTPIQVSPPGIFFLHQSSSTLMVKENNLDSFVEKWEGGGCTISFNLMYFKILFVISICRY